ncbi:protein lifeguard 1-like [Rhinatrema bivittatum]|uniref:protein lifeguard 1-like n=1 Tax=Rhinatrema bivittatum TaxID=194408 RepID=UPI00112D1BBA|nr:protein lifeguard 1-like [Rhinatrema bivittatum]XP_029444726.1 protein lifeguard 1-like [Rhinatrema bivittatum]XP_029444727.1 protein lifeguard 1-like [Rhinatrema bivittatum]
MESDSGAPPSYYAGAQPYQPPPLGSHEPAYPDKTSAFSPPQQEAGAAPAYSVYPAPAWSPPSFKEGGVPTVEQSGLEDPAPEYCSPMEDSSQFSEKVLRRAFIRKVYLILAVQLALTVGIICMFIYWPTLQTWVRRNSWFTYALLGAVFVLVIVLACCNDARRKFPVNFILLGLFTIFEGLMLGAISVFFEADAVMWAVGATAFVTLGLSVFALQTKWDFTMASGIMVVVLLALLAFGLLCAIIRSFWLQIVYASLGVLIFAVYLVVDTQLMMGGKHRYSIDPEEYVFAALNLYLDIINLFLFILQIIGLSR